MNLPTIGALMRQFPISDFSIMSKVITEVNGRVGIEHQIKPEMTGDMILAIYHRLPYTIQQQFYEEDIISRVEEQGLYTEIKVISENNNLKMLYNNNMSSTLLLDVNLILLVIFSGVTLLYRQNTINMDDQIQAHFLSTILNVLKILITSII
jgi:uncharacterized protein YaaW (UPF0174 family)